MKKIINVAVLFIILLSATARAADCSVTSTGLMPLYPSIFVPRTAEEQSAALAAVNSIPAGGSVLLSIGPSNAKGVWDAFLSDSDDDPLKSADVNVVNGANAGGSAAKWAVQDEVQTWGELEDRLASAGASKASVSVIWFMIVNSVNSNPLDEYATGLETDVRDALDLFAINFPNLKIVWLQSMIYAGYSTASGNYEPFAHETGLVAQSLVMDQNWPFFVGYGPYLWADGTVARDDGLTWLCTDFKDDGNHPGPDGQMKHSDYLLQFFHEDDVASIGYLDAGMLLTVPDLVGLDQATAESSIVSAGLMLGAVSTANSDTVVAGSVISQSPTGGSKVASGAAVDLVVSLGPAQQVTVPDLVGLDQTTAESSIVSAGLVVGAVGTANSDTVVAGNVISQSPTGGSIVTSATAVDLVVSLGPLIQVTVPDVVGLDQATAELTVLSAGLIVGAVSTATNETVLAGNVISQSPAAGSSVTSDTAVDLVVSLGPAVGVPMMILPIDGSILSGSSETFTWTAGGEAVSRWRLEVGTTPGGRDIYLNTFSSDVTSQLVTGLPTDGSLVYVSLKWRTATATAQASYVYTASGDGPPPAGTPAMTVPTPGSVLSGASETFTWSAESAAVSKWRLEVGTAIDGKDLFVQNFDAATTSTTVNGLPTDGSPIYVNLKWRIGSLTSTASYVYTASGGP